MKVSHKIKQRKQIKKQQHKKVIQTDLENDPERVYFEKVYDLLIAQNKLESPCFDYQLNDERLSLCSCKYK